MTLVMAVAVLTGTVATARAVRLLTHDHYPPAAALRRWWWNRTVARGGWRAGWHLLLVGETPDEPGCPFCLTPYAAAVNLTWGVLAGVWVLPLDGWAAAWWIVNGWAAASYAAAMVVVRDEPA